ncbi:P-loop NTPase fold protein [Nocardioides luteus]|uniref:P-loop NTPase fold protein n=1 Tax=Nocardioides luteus TaxID=1844 RepID=UPI0018CB780A|nr:P-loop NTPase fold protein [Nocardioides luteus]MBG6096395.1 plasmid stabilization system protein ParE [Nocardioides luteus]
MPHDGAAAAPDDAPTVERESHGHSADGGVASLRAILRRTKEQVGPYHQDARDARWALARATLLAPRGELGDAETNGRQFRAERCAQVFVEHLDDAVAAHGAPSWQARSARAELSRAYRLLLEDPTSQVRVYDDHLRTVLADGTHRMIDQVRARQDLANAYADIHKFDEAIALYQENVDSLERSERFGAHSRYSDHARRLLDWAQKARRDVGADRMPVRRPRLRPSAHRHAVPLEDGPAMADLLGVDSDVDALGRMIAARSTQPPLAIALLAPWGGGKSTFMRLLKHKVEVELPAEDPATFHTSVDVVEFNPWHYSDTHVMVGMSRAIFESLTRYLERRVAESGSTETSWREQVEERKALTATRSRLERTQDALRTNSVVQRPRAALIALRTLPDLVLGRNHKVMRILVMLSAASFLVALAAVLGWEAWGLDVGARMRAWADVVLRSAPALLVLSTVWATILEGVPKAAAIHRKVRSGASWLVGFVAAGVDAEIGRIDERLKRTEARPTTAAVADLETILSDPERAAERDVQRGVVGVLQTQFEELAEAYGLGRDGTLGTQVAADDLRIRRIVLHVDDLDRCRPERVVEVLHTLNLLQATRLFVAVVSVDPRWLRRSLRELDPTRPGDSDASEVSGRLRDEIGDPLDFLDKIIQIPYALRPMNASNAEEYFSRLVRSHDLDDPRIEEPDPEAAVGAGVMAPPSAPEHLDQRRPALQLTVTPREWDYLRPLAAAQETPRAVKRFLNLYQLLRLTSGLGMEEEEGILGDDVHAARRAAATLLAVLVGAPRQGSELLAEMLSVDAPEHTLDTLVDDLQSRHLHDPSGPHSRRRQAGTGRCNVCVGWRRIRDVVQPPGSPDEEGGPADGRLRVGDFRPWVGEVARFSFHSEAMGLAGVVARA